METLQKIPFICLNNPKKSFFYDLKNKNTTISTILKKHKQIKNLSTTLNANTINEKPILYQKDLFPFYFKYLNHSKLNFYKIFLRNLTGKKLSIYTYPEITIEDLKIQIQNEVNLKPDQQRLIWAGIQLANNRT